MVGLESIGLFNPSDQELEKLGLSRFTYDDNWLGLAKLAGTFRFSRSFTVIYHSTRILALFTMIGFIFGSFREGDIEDSFECVQYILIVVMMYGGCSAFGYYQNDFLGLLRLIGEGGFDYRGTLTREAKDEIARCRSRTSDFKKGFKNIFLVVLVTTSFSICGKKPLGVLIRGRGKKDIDGEDNLIWNGAFGMYWPFAEHWIPYILALTFNNFVSAWVVIGNVGYASAFLLTAEEILCEFAVVNCTFRHCLRRAKLLYTDKINGIFNTKNEKQKANTIEDCLKYCIYLSVEHHHQTLRAFNSLKKIMYIPLLILIVGWAMVTCLSVYLLLSDDVSLDFKLPLPILLFAEAFVAFVYCYYGQRFTDACVGIGSSIYEGADWMEYSNVLKPYILIIHGYCDIPNGFSAGGFSGLNHLTFSNMISTAYSYIGFLLST